jgi:deoxyribose-phosphate aldolase
MNEAQLRTVVEEVVKALDAKGLLKTVKCECENGPKPLRGTVVTSVGSSGKIFGNASSWGAAPAKGQFSALPPKPVHDEDDEDAHVDAKIIQAAGASRVSVCKPTKKGTDTARYLDHTLLKPNATQEEIGKLCDEARQFCFASVCVNPSYVAIAAQLLRGSGVKVCTVVGFPLGSTTPTVKAIEARDAMANGADEIDMVINIGALKSGNDAMVYEDIKAVREATRGKILKTILETSLLSNEEKVRACAAAKKAGADFVKTSTGFGGGGATVEDIKLMRGAVGPLMGVKASGGIRDAKTATDMIAAGATRLGTSASVAIVTDVKSEAKGY